jgi:hypothetical protein
MKNRKFERDRKLQKQYGSKPNQNLTDGIVVRHLYGNAKDTPDPTIKSWWDDTGFMLNGTRISIWWTHPRSEFNDAIGEIAHENVPYPDYKDESDMFDNSTKIYKKVGKSGLRKKIIGYQTNDGDNRSKIRHEWYLKLKAEEDRLRIDNAIVIKPFMKVESFEWCRGVSICAPIEVRGIPDLKFLCDLVKRVLKGQTTLDKEFPAYTYTKEDWVKEDAEASLTGLFVHAVKI